MLIRHLVPRRAHLSSHLFFQFFVASDDSSIPTLPVPWETNSDARVRLLLTEQETKPDRSQFCVARPRCWMTFNTRLWPRYLRCLVWFLAECCLGLYFWGLFCFLFLSFSIVLPDLRAGIVTLIFLLGAFLTCLLHVLVCVLTVSAYNRCCTNSARVFPTAAVVSSSLQVVKRLLSLYFITLRWFLFLGSLSLRASQVLF